MSFYAKSIAEVFSEFQRLLWWSYCHW